MEMKEKDLKKLLSKLRRPVYFGYISKYILHEDYAKTKEILNQLIEEGYIEECKDFPQYYVTKKQDNK